MSLTPFRLAEFRIEPDRDRIYCGTDSWEVEPKTMAVLLALAAAPGVVISSEELIRTVWQGRPMGVNPVYKAIFRLRRVFRDDAETPRIIETVPRKGYRLLVPVRPLDSIDSIAIVEPLERSVPASRPRLSEHLGHRRRHFGLFGALALGLLALIVYGRSARFWEPDAAAPRQSRTAIAGSTFFGGEYDLSQLHALARTELRDRQPAFEGRLRLIADEMLRRENGYAPGYVVRAMGCAFTAYHQSLPIIAMQEVLCAREAVNTALRRAPESAEAQAVAGLVELTEYLVCRSTCSSQQNLARARVYLLRAQSLDSQLPEAHIWLEEVYERTGALALAAAEAEAAVALDPSNPIINVNYAEILSAWGRPREARERLLWFADRPGAPPQVARVLGEFAADTCETAELHRWTGIIAAHAWHGLNSLSAAEVLARCGFRDEALRYADRLDLPAATDSEATLRSRLWLLVALGDANALRAFSQKQQEYITAPADVNDVNDRIRRQIAGTALAFSGQARAAIELLESVYGVPAKLPAFVDIRPEIDALDTLAWLYRSRGDSAHAAAAATAALEATRLLAEQGLDRNLTGRMHAALTEELAGHHESALALLDRLVANGGRPGFLISVDPRWSSALADQHVRNYTSGLAKYSWSPNEPR